jgi:hypothetical protein
MREYTRPRLSFPQNGLSREPDVVTRDGFTYLTRGVAGRRLEIARDDEAEPFTVVGGSRPARTATKEDKRRHLVRAIIELTEERALDHVFVPIDLSLPVQLVSSDGGLVCPRETIIECYYDRISGKRKIVNRTWLFDQMPCCDPNSALLRYDELFAVDTNTVQHSGGKKLSLTSVCSFKASVSDGHVFCGELQECGCALNYDLDNPEPLSWLGIIRRLRREQGQAPTLRIGVIVDADLGKIGAYNQRLEPVANGLLLPPNVSLIFATRDSGRSTYLSNKLIAVCDAYANKIWGKLRLLSEVAIKDYVNSGPPLSRLH